MGKPVPALLIIQRIIGRGAEPGGIPHRKQQQFLIDPKVSIHQHHLRMVHQLPVQADGDLDEPQRFGKVLLERPTLDIDLRRMIDLQERCQRPAVIEVPVGNDGGIYLPQVDAPFFRVFQQRVARPQIKEELVALRLDIQ